MSEKGGQATSRRVNPPLKWHIDGGKAYLAPKIVALMPPHVHYVEPYAGGLSVLLAKDPEGVSEVVNDLNGDLTIFWRVMQDEGNFREFVRRVEATPFSESEWDREPEGEPRHGTELKYVSAVETAVRFFVRCRQSLAGRMKSFTGVTKTRTRRGMNNEVSAWLSAVEGLPAVHERLKRVLILNRDALEVIRSQDGPGTLFYLDPPYLHTTRVTTADYAHEMTRLQHADLLSALDKLKGKFLLSGYRSELYDGFATALGWHRTDFTVANHAAGGKAKRRMVESVWTNFNPEGAS
jgi:DNA adenine methylase